MKNHVTLLGMISVLMVGCPSDPAPTSMEEEPSFDCRISAYQCADGFTCEPIGSGEFSCIRAMVSGGTMSPTGGAEMPGGMPISGTEVTGGTTNEGAL